jgi:hypothetical protein
MAEASGRGTDGPETRASTATYIAALTEELAQLAKRHGLLSLGYILEMAHLEAAEIAKATGSEKKPAA